MQEQVTNVILGNAGPSDRFTLRYGWLSFRLKIRPLSAKQLIAISGEISKIGTIDEKKDMFPELMSGISNARHIAKVIAIATGTRYKWIVTRALLGLPLKDIETLFKIVHKQSDPTPYFFFMVLAKGRMNILQTTKEQ